MTTQALSPMDYFKKVITQDYANFSGRARRAEYWWFVLMTAVVGIVIAILASILASISDGLGAVGFALYGIYGLALIVPSLAVLVRRLHDTDRSGWWYFIAFVPLVGGIVLLVFLASDSKPQGTNQYGPSPKYGV